MAIIEKIQVQMQLLTDKFNKPMKEAENAMRELNKKAVAQTEKFEKLSSVKKKAQERTTALKDQNMKFGQVMNMSMERFKAFNEQGFRFNKVGGRMANGLRKVTHGMRGFRMEALGVMFFGMSMQRMFAGLLGPVAEAFGVFELFKTMLTILFLPIMEAIFPQFLAMMDFFMNLPGPVKKAIGVFVIVGTILGTIIMLLGTLTLGLGSLILFWPIISAAASAAMATVVAVFSPVIAIIGIIIAVVIGMVIAWRNNFLGMKKVVSNFFSGIADFFNGFITFISGFFLIIKGIFMGDWTLIWEGVKKIFWGAIQAIWGIVKVLINGIGAIFIGIVQIVWNVIKLIIAPFVWLWNFLVGHSLIPDLINAIIGWFQKLPGKIWDAVKGIGALIAKGFTRMIPDWLLDILKKGISIGGSFMNSAGSIFGFAKGGVVPGPKGAPMPAIVHGGERIIPNGGGMSIQSSPNITIHAKISNDYDVRKLADELKRYWVDDFERVSQGRGF